MAVPSQSPDESLVGIKKSLDDHGADILQRAKAGAAIYMIAGNSDYGKSHFMYALQRAIAARHGGTIANIVDQTNGAAAKTDRGQYFSWDLRVGRRRYLVCDIAGETFEQIAATTPPEHLIPFLCNVLPHVRGITLNVALHHLWATPGSTDALINAYVVFLSYAVIAAANWSTEASVLEKLVSDPRRRNDALAMCQPIGIPVFINFSMADKYEGLQAPTQSWNGNTEIGVPNLLPQRTVNPAVDDPMVLAYLYLPVLFNFIQKHVRWFKFDFTQAKDENQPNGNHNHKGCIEAYEFLAEVPWPGFGFLDSRRYAGWHLDKSTIQRFLERNGNA